MDKTLPSPTAEQIAILDAVRTGEDTAAEALAGTGKTTTFRLMAADDLSKTVAYLCYNRSIAKEASAVFPSNTQCKTTHSLAFGTHGKMYGRRLNGPRQTSHDVARALALTDIVTPSLQGQTRLSAPFLGSLVIEALRKFASSADAEPMAHHVRTVQGLDPLNELGEPTRGPNSKHLANELVPSLRRAWSDIRSPGGRLPFEHDYYLKMYQLDEPRIFADRVALDEAQDTSACVLSIVRQQSKHAQLLYVGDQYQMIYAWRGALNAMREADVVHRRWLTTSFRFGADIAATANRLLRSLGSEALLVGAGKPGIVAAINEPRAVLTRTNAGALRAYMRLLNEGKSVAIVADVKRELIPFFEAADKLQAGERVSHRDLAAFSTWGEVVAYVETDELGSDLGLLVSLVDEFGARNLVDLLRRAGDEDFCDVTISTAHKSKGRQWSTVQLGDDFPDPDAPTKGGGRRGLSPEEKRLLYVACTRAQVGLDVTRVRALASGSLSSVVATGQGGWSDVAFVPESSFGRIAKARHDAQDGGAL